MLRSFKPIYFELLDPATHQSIYTLLIEDMQFSQDIFTSIAIALTCILNTFAMILLLFLPAYIWYNYLKKRKISFSIFNTAIFSSIMLLFYITDLLAFITISTKELT